MSKAIETDQLVQSSYLRRRLVNWAMIGVLAVAAVVALVPLFSLFSYVVARGLPGLDLAFFTELPTPVGEAGGGMANAVVGTLTLVVLAALFGIPWGLALGIYLSEYGSSRLAKVVRFCVEILASVPAIVVGLFVYALLVVTMKRFSAIAGGVALSVLAIPTVARATEELLRMVPITVREAGGIL